MEAAEDARREVEESRRRLEFRFRERARTFKVVGSCLLTLTAVCWAWVVIRTLTEDSIVIDTDSGLERVVGWALWSEVMIVLTASVPLGLIGAVTYTRGATSLELGHHMVSMAEHK